MTAMPDSERLFSTLEAIRELQGRNHTEVVQRLTKLETLQHSPEDCRRTMATRQEVRAVELEVQEVKEAQAEHKTEHKEAAAQAQKAGFVKKMIDYAGKAAVAAGLVYGGSKYGGG